MKNNPFIKKFSVAKDHYIYDTNTNAFLEVDRICYDLIDFDALPGKEKKEEILKKYQPGEISDAQNLIAQMKKKGYFSNHRPAITYFTKYPEKDFIRIFKSELQKNLRRITLNITENCNLRCRYCPYSGAYLYYRQHNCKIMSSEIMKKAVDFYFSYNRNVDNKTISFYGGEPLLNFNIIKDCVDYVNNEYSKHSDTLTLKITTNGTLLTRKKIEFMILNKFRLLISIDGPKNLHDRYRVFKNGTGTFSRVMQNLILLKSLDTDYYKNNVAFNIVLAPPYDFDSLGEFISDENIRPKNIMLHSVGTKDSLFFNRFSRNDIQKGKQKLARAHNVFVQKIKDNSDLTEIENKLFEMRYLDIHNRSMDRLPPKFSSQGQCLIGTRALTINTDGTFNFCTQLPNVFNMGNVYTGFDYDRINEFYMKLDSFLKDRCYDCWAIRFCIKCIKHINTNGNLDENVFNNFCRFSKKIIFKKIKEYIKIRKEKENAFSFLNDVRVY